MFRRVMALAAFTVVLAACSQSPFGGGPPQPVTFTVTARADAFSDREPVVIRVYDADQLAIAEQTANCNISKDVATGEEKVSCPPGVTYRPTTPEETSVPREQLAQGVVIASKTVVVGERYRVTLGGKAADNCNSAGAMTEGVAGGPTIAVKDLAIAQTLIGCPEPASP